MSNDTKIKRRFYYNDSEVILQSETSNVINTNFKNFIEDDVISGDYSNYKVDLVNKKLIPKTEEEIENEKIQNEKSFYDSLVYYDKRLTKYPEISDQVDAIYKGFQAIKDKITLPQETLDWLDQCKKVKEDIPKE